MSDHDEPLYSCKTQATVLPVAKPENGNQTPRHESVVFSAESVLEYVGEAVRVEPAEAWLMVL